MSIINQVKIQHALNCFPQSLPKWTIKREKFEKDGKIFIKTTKTLTEYGYQDLLRFSEELERKAEIEKDQEEDSWRPDRY